MVASKMHTLPPPKIFEENVCFLIFVFLFRIVFINSASIGIEISY